MYVQKQVSYPLQCGTKASGSASNRSFSFWYSSHYRSHAPSLGLALEGRFHFLEDGSFGRAASRMNLEEFNPAPARNV